MEFNRILSLIIGAIVVILIIVWIGGRFRTQTQGAGTAKVTPTLTPTATPTPTGTQNKGWNFMSFFQKKPTATPTPTVSLGQAGSIRMKRTSPTPTILVQNIPQSNILNNTTYTNDYHSYDNTAIKQIPNTGSPTEMIPLAISAITGGLFLSKFRRK